MFCPRSSRSTALGSIVYAPGGGGLLAWVAMGIKGNSSKSWEWRGEEEAGLEFCLEIPH